MIASKEKLDDMHWRLDLLQQVGKCLRKYQETGEEKYKDLAKEFGEESQRTNEFILHGDYTERDRVRAMVDRMLSYQFK